MNKHNFSKCLCFVESTIAYSANRGTRVMSGGNKQRVQQVCPPEEENLRPAITGDTSKRLDLSRRQISADNRPEEINYLKHRPYYKSKFFSWTTLRRQMWHELFTEEKKHLIPPGDLLNVELSRLHEWLNGLEDAKSGGYFSIFYLLHHLRLQVINSRP